MDNQHHRLIGPATRNAVQRLALGSLYLSLLFVLLSASFLAPLMSEISENGGFSADAGLGTPVIPVEEPIPAHREG